MQDRTRHPELSPQTRFVMHGPDRSFAGSRAGWNALLAGPERQSSLVKRLDNFSQQYAELGHFFLA